MARSHSSARVRPVTMSDDEGMQRWELRAAQLRQEMSLSCARPSTSLLDLTRMWLPSICCCSQSARAAMAARAALASVWGMQRPRAELAEPRGQLAPRALLNSV